MWLLDQLAPGWLIRRKLHLRGELRSDSLTTALRDLSSRHDMLRTRFRSVDGVVTQEVAECVFECPFHDLRDLEPQVRDARLASIDLRQATTFDLEAGPLWRAELARITDTHHILWLTLHDLIADGWSMGNLARELPELYAAHVAGRAPRLPPLAIQYGDFAAWEQQQLASDAHAAKLAYWRDQLDGVKPVALPTTGQRKRERPAAHLSFDIPADVAEGLRTICTGENVTLFVGLLTALQLLLARGSGDDDIAIATFVANREQPETRHVFGRFSNTVVLRSRLGSAVTFRDALQLVRTVVREGMAHQDVPFEQVVSTVHAATAPFFNVLFSLNGLASPMRMEGLELAPEWSAPTQTAFDLSLTVFPQKDRSLGATWEYDASLIRRDVISQLIDQLDRLLAQFAAAPDQALAEVPFERFDIDHVTAAPELRSTGELVAPRDAIEQQLADIWQRLLGLERVGVRDDFFALGGHSLLAVRFVAAVAHTLGARLPVRLVFEKPTIEEFAREVVRAAPTGGEPHAHTDLAIRPGTGRRRGPVLPALRGMLKIDRVDPVNTLNRMSYSIWLDGPVNTDALERALHAMRARHGILRSRFYEEDGTQWQEVLDTLDLPVLYRDDVSALSGERRASADAELQADFVRRPFALTTGETVRALLVTHAPARHRLTIVFHHIIADPQTLRIFDEELSTLWRAYTADPERATSVLPPPTAEALDLIDYLERLAASDVGAANLAFWRAQLDDIASLEIPTDMSRAEWQARRAAEGGLPIYRCAVVKGQLGPDCIAGLERIVRATKASMYSVLFAVMGEHLTAITGQEDLALVSHLLYRHLPGLERSLGFFSNPLVMRVSTAGSPSFVELVQRTHTTVTNAFDHAECDVFAVARRVFRVFFNYHFTADLVGQAAPEAPPGVTRSSAPLAADESEVQAYEMILFIDAYPEQINFHLKYSEELFRPETAGLFLEQYLGAVQSRCANGESE